MKISKKAKYEVLNDDGEIILSGNILGEVIETTILNTFRYLEENRSLLFKIEKNYYSYYNILATIYRDANDLYWENIEIIELIHNNRTFLDSNRFIKFRKNNWTLIDSRIRIDLNKDGIINWQNSKMKV